MSFLDLKSKIKPKYTRSNSEIVNEDISDTIRKPQNKTIENSTLMIGEGVTITGTIKARSEVTIQGTIDGDIECNSVTINKSGNVKGKIKAETMMVEGKAEGQMNVNQVLNIKSEGCVNGKIFYGEIQIDQGGKLSGEINHRDKDSKQEEFKNLKVI